MKRSNKKAVPLAASDEERLCLYLRRAFAIAAPHVANGDVHFTSLYKTALDKELEKGAKSEEISIVQLPDGNAHALEWDRYGAIQLKEAYESSLKSANTIRSKIANDVRIDRPLPMGLKHFLALLLDRQVKEPSNPKNRPTVAHRDLLLKAIGILLRHEFNLTIGATHQTLDKQSEWPIRGATVAAAAIYGLGCRRITPEQALKIVAKSSVDPTGLIEAGVINAADAPILLHPAPTSELQVTTNHKNDIEWRDPMKRALQFLNRK